MYLVSIGGREVKSNQSCILCGEYIRRFRMAKHFKKRHPEYSFNSNHAKGKIVYACAICGASTSSFPGLVRHYQVQHPQTPGLSERKEITNEQREYRRLNMRKYREQQTGIPFIQSAFNSCLVCGENIHIHQMTEHFKKAHQEYLFNKTRSNKKTSFICSICGRKNLPGFKEIINHYKKYHQNTIVKSNPPIERTSIDSVQNLDNFFGGMGQLVKEVKTMRELCDNYEQENIQIIEQLNSKVKECEGWKAKATQWSEQVVAVQAL